MALLKAIRRVRSTTALMGLWVCTEIACGARSPLLGPEEEGVEADANAGGSSSLSSGGSMRSQSGGARAVGGSQGPSGSGGDHPPDDGGRGVQSSGGAWGERPVLCDPSANGSCENGGECIPSAGSTHQCLCRPGTFGAQCEFYIYQATSHCLLGSDGYVRDCPPDFIGVQAEFGRLKRITTYYQSGSTKGESLVSYFAGLDPLGYPRLFSNGMARTLPPSTFRDILLGGHSLWLLTTEAELIEIDPESAHEEGAIVRTPSRLTQLGVTSATACGLTADHFPECWMLADHGTLSRSPPPFSEKLAFLSRGADAGLTETGALRCIDQASCSALEPFGPFVWVESGCALSAVGDVYCVDGAFFPGPFDWFVLQGLESPTRFCGSRRDTHEFVCTSLVNQNPALPPPMQALDVAINDSCVWVIDQDQILHCYPRHDRPTGAVSLTSLPGSFDKLFAGELICARRRVPAERLECWARGAWAPELRTGYVDQVHTQSGASLKDGLLTYLGAPPGDEKVRLLSSGPDFCVVTEAGMLRCRSSHSTNGRPRDNDTQELVTGDFVDIQGGTDFNCALERDGTVRCWGADETKMRSPPGRFQQVTCAQETCCGIALDSGVDCWGRFGLAGPFAGHFQKVALWKSTLCGIRTDGTLICRDDLRVP